MKVLKCSIIEFRKKFKTEDLCKEFLYNSKWKKGYRYLKCQQKKEKKGNGFLDRRCATCGYNETVTSNTLSHSIKFSLTIAFEIIYRISVNKKGISSISISREYDLNFKTAYNFKRKVQKSMSSSEQYSLKGEVHIDEFMYGGKEKGKQGRSSDSKKLNICLAMELKEDKHQRKSYQ